MITIRNLRKEFSESTPLKDVNAVIERGEVVSIIGPSGSGKSTLIRCINMLVTPTSGEIIIDGVNVTGKDCKIEKVRRKMGMVFQSFNLFEHLTVIENIMAAPMDLLGKSKQEAYDRGMELLCAVGLGGKELRYPRELSGGQQQRAAIVRTLAMDPEIILFDEPTSALDPTTKGEVEMVIKNLAKQGITMLIVTHDMRFAKEAATRVFYMDEGGIYEDGTPEQIFGHPQREKTKRFVRNLKVFEESIVAGEFDFIGIMSGLDTFGRRHMLQQRTIYRMQAVFEEVCVQAILPTLERDSRLSFAAEYSEGNGTVEMRLKYGGGRFDPTEKGDELAMQIAGRMADSIVYSCDDEYGNLVTMVIKDAAEVPNA